MTDETEAPYRRESIAAVEQGVKALGLSQVVAAYLATTYGAHGLDELPSDDLTRAFKFIATLTQQLGRRQPLPIAPGSTLDGEVMWVSGKLEWGKP